MATNASGLRERRSFLSRLTAGVAIVGGTVFGSRRAAAQSTGAAAPWRPTRHPQDDWLDQIPGSHRFIVDSITPGGLGTALLHTNNFFIGSQQGYQLGNGDAAVVIVLRHNSTPFAYTDAMWAKYSAAISEAAGFVDPKTKGPAVINAYNSGSYAGSLNNNGVTLDALIGRGVHFAVCQMATRRFATVIAGAHKLEVEAVIKELTSNLIRNSHMVPAGIVAVNRAQERGYAFANAG